jgi:hypothetical protein
MLNWLRGAAQTSEEPAFDLAKVAGDDLAVIFKHSTSCPISFRADRQINAFRAEHPEVPGPRSRMAK